MESSTEGSSNSDEESNEITHPQWTRGWKNEEKKSIYVTKETFYRQWEETVVALKTHIHRKCVQVNRKHYL